MQLKLSIIIVNYNSKKYLKGCLDSIFKFGSLKNLEVILVNNSPSEKLVFKDVVVIENSQNLGFSKACNLGAKNAHSEILLFLNPDAKILSNFEIVLNLFAKDKKIGIVGSTLITEKGALQNFSFGKKQNLIRVLQSKLPIGTLPPKGFSLRLRQLANGRLGESLFNIDTDWVSGASLFVRKNLFKKIEGFDEKFFMYFEDQDLCIRVKKLGYKVIVSKEFRVCHLRGASFRLEDSSLKKKYYYSSQDYYYKKNTSIVEYLLMKIIRRLWLKMV